MKKKNRKKKTNIETRISHSLLSLPLMSVRAFDVFDSIVIMQLFFSSMCFVAGHKTKLTEIDKKNKVAKWAHVRPLMRINWKKKTPTKTNECFICRAKVLNELTVLNWKEWKTNNYLYQYANKWNQTASRCLMAARSSWKCKK